MVRINKIYTRTGDSGETGLVGGSRTNKDSSRVSAYGDVDELNAFIGAARTLAEKHGAKNLGKKLALIQNELFDIGSELATPPDEHWEGMITVKGQQIKRLEKWIDECIDGLPTLKSFVLPGGTEVNASLHIARTVCRRVERNVIKLSRDESVAKNVIIYFNRLSDLLFAMARNESARAKIPEYLWEPQKTQSKKKR